MFKKKQWSLKYFIAVSAGTNISWHGKMMAQGFYCKSIDNEQNFFFLSNTIQRLVLVRYTFYDFRYTSKDNWVCLKFTIKSSWIYCCSVALMIYKAHLLGSANDNKWFNIFLQSLKLFILFCCCFLTIWFALWTNCSEKSMMRALESSSNHVNTSPSLSQETALVLAHPWPPGPGRK